MRFEDISYPLLLYFQKLIMSRVSFSKGGFFQMTMQSSPSTTAENVKELQPYITVLTDHEKEKVKQIIQQFPSLNILDVDDEILTEVQLASLDLPSRVVDSLIRFRRNPNPYGTLLFRNLPTDPELPPTPKDGRFSQEKHSFVSEYSLLLFMMFLGEPIAYEDEKEGLLIQNICPVKGQEKKQENTRSNYLNFHTEDGFHPYPPDHLALLGLRSDHEKIAETITASVRNVVDTLPGTAVMLLRQPIYRLHPSSSFKLNQHEDYSVRLPVLTGNLSNPQMCIHYSSMVAENEEAEWALNLLRKALLKVSVAFKLLPGDLLIMDNRLVAHARTPFRPRYDGKDRWLQRMFTVVDFHRSGFSRGHGKHVCSPLNVEFTKDVHFSNGDFPRSSAGERSLVFFGNSAIRVKTINGWNCCGECSL